MKYEKSALQAWLAAAKPAIEAFDAASAEFQRAVKAQAEVNREFDETLPAYLEALSRWGQCLRDLHNAMPYPSDENRAAWAEAKVIYDEATIQRDAAEARHRAVERRIPAINATLDAAQDNLRQASYARERAFSAIEYQWQKDPARSEAEKLVASKKAEYAWRWHQSG
jgi:hypothetical protein